MAKEKSETMLEKGLSSQQSLDRNYEPRTSGEGQRPNPAKRVKVGKFTFA